MGASDWTKEAHKEVCEVQKISEWWSTNFYIEQGKMESHICLQSQLIQDQPFNSAITAVVYYPRPN